MDCAACATRNRTTAERFAGLSDESVAVMTHMPALKPAPGLARCADAGHGAILPLVGTGARLRVRAGMQWRKRAGVKSSPRFCADCGQTAF